MASHFLDDFDFKYDLEDCPTVEDLKNFCMDINFKRLEVKQKRFKDIRKYILLTNLVERVDHQIRIQQEANQEFLLALQVNYLELSSQLVTSSSQTIYSASPFELNNTQMFDEIRSLLGERRRTQRLSQRLRSIFGTQGMYRRLRWIISIFSEGVSSLLEKVRRVLISEPREYSSV